MRFLIQKVRGNRFITLDVFGYGVNLSFQKAARRFYLNNIGDQMSQWDDDLIFAVQVWRLGFSVEPKDV